MELKIADMGVVRYKDKYFMAYVRNNQKMLVAGYCFDTRQDAENALEMFKAGFDAGKNGLPKSNTTLEQLLAMVG